MSPQGRHDYPRAIHLMSIRGRPGDAIFFSADILRESRSASARLPPDLQFWECLIARACDRYAARVHAYAWLPNEALLILQRFLVPLDTVVASVLGQYSRYLHRVGRSPTGASPYRSRYESVEVAPGVLPYGVRHIYGCAAEYSASPIDYPFCSRAFHYAEAAPRWFERRDFIDGLEQRGYFGRSGGERFLLRPETVRHKALFGLRSGRKRGIAGEPVDVQDSRWQAQHPTRIPSIEDVAAAVNGLIQRHSVAASGGVLGKSLVAWYATRSGAATLDELGQRYARSPTTLRRDIESHRRKQPELFAHTIDELLGGKIFGQQAPVTADGMFEAAADPMEHTFAPKAAPRRWTAGKYAPADAASMIGRLRQTAARPAPVRGGGRAHSSSGIPVACTATCNPYIDGSEVSEPPDGAVRRRRAKRHSPKEPT